MSRSRMFLSAVALISLLVVPVAIAGEGGTNRPFEAALAGLVTWAFPGASLSNCTIATTLSEVTGQVTHLGRVSAFSSHCPGEPGYVNDGRWTFIAANGDKLYGIYDYDPASQSNAIPTTLNGGTGRFTNASGAVVVTYQVIPQFIPGCNPVPDPFPCLDFSVPWPGTWIITGTLTY